MKTTQVMLIHGGETFKNRNDYIHYIRTRKISIENKKRWSADLIRKLGKSFKLIMPRMPKQDDAKYSDWKIHFERHIPFLKDGIILIGNSLGGIFLAKYLSEHKLPKKILSLYIIAAPFDDTLPSDDLVGGFKLKSNLSLIEKNCKKITIMFSKDDDVVPVAHAEKFRKKMKNAKIIIYKSKNGHFNVQEFPELVRMIKSDVKKNK